VYVALGAASIVEPHGFSGSLPVMIFLCVVNSVSLFRRIKMFLFFKVAIVAYDLLKISLRIITS